MSARLSAAVLLAVFAAAATGQPAATDTVRAARRDTLPVVPLEPLVSNVFYETDLRQALSDISAQTGVQIITDGTIAGMVTVELRAVPLGRALGRILYPLGYTCRRIDDYYVVGAAKPDGAAFPMLARSQLLDLDYIRAADAAKLLAECYTPYIKVIPETNTLVATAPPEILSSIRRDLDSIDQPKRQVTIEATVLEVASDAGRSFGVDWSGSLVNGADTLLRAITGIGGIADTTLSLVFKRLIGRIGVMRFLALPSVQAMVQDGKVQIKANPRIVTADGQPAEINVGKEQYYQLLSSAGTYPVYRLEKIEYGVSMTITPFVAENGDITVYAEPRVSDVVGAGPDNLPIVSKRTARTRVVVKDGESIVIGGLVMRNEQLVQRRIPLLGSIPILGFFFSNTRKIVSNSEVVIIITPRLM